MPMGIRTTWPPVLMALTVPPQLGLLLGPEAQVLAPLGEEPHGLLTGHLCPTWAGEAQRA